ncbi:MAG TPA: glycosyl hydrolase family 8 [Opitutaceae bacterium]|jgi:oligosaccharide reducing-end xylanase
MGRFLLMLLACAASARGAGPERTADLFGSLLGRSGAEVDAKISGAWHQYFRGDEQTERLFYPVGADTAYVPDIASNDVRTEGLSYAMMISVQTDHQADFNRIWKWAMDHMYHADGPYRGYFGWHADFNGRLLDAGPASDGEEWFTAALFFAAHRWGSGQGIFNYESEAQALVRTMLHKSEEPGHGDVTDMFDPAARQVVFVPHGTRATYTDPSYHLPAFYETWARWAREPADRAFLASAAKESRILFRKAANPSTGLMPDYSEFDGRPRAFRGHEDFSYDAWRTLSNPAVDYAWNRSDPAEVEQSNRVLRFLLRDGVLQHDRFRLDGTPLSNSPYSAGLVSMAASAGQAADPALAKPFVERLWSMDPPSGRYRYYNGLLYLLSLLETGGRFQAYNPRG